MFPHSHFGSSARFLIVRKKRPGYHIVLAIGDVFCSPFSGVNEGDTVHVDLGRMFKMLKKHGYKRYCSMEFDAPGGPYKATAKLVNATIQYLSLGRNAD